MAGRKNRWGLPSNLMRRINKLCEQTVQDSIEAIAKDYKKQYEDIIWKFYEHYTPKKYMRTYSLLEGINLSSYNGQLRQAISMPSRFSRELNVELSSQYYDNPNPYRLKDKMFNTTEEVFSSAIDFGLHGQSDINYTTNGLIGREDKNRPRMKPSPYKLMVKYDQFYHRENNMKKVTTPIFKKNLEKYLYT